MGGISFAPVSETAGKYVADSEGNIYGPRGLLKQSPRRARALRGNPGKDHRCVAIYGATGRKVQFAHRVVYRAFHGDVPAGLVVRHVDGDELNNRLTNLTVGTHADNVADSVRHGTHMAYGKGELHPGALFTVAQVTEIRARHARGGVSHTEIAAEFGVDRSTISDMIRRKSWKDCA